MSDYSRFKKEVREFEKRHTRYAGPVSNASIQKDIIKEAITGLPPWKTSPDGKTIIKSPFGKKYRKVISVSPSAEEVAEVPYNGLEAISLSWYTTESLMYLSIGEIDKAINWVSKPISFFGLATPATLYDGFSLTGEYQGTPGDWLFVLRDLNTWNILVTHSVDEGLWLWNNPPIWLYRRQTGKTKFISVASGDDNVPVLINGVACGINANMVEWVNDRLICIETRPADMGQNWASLYRVIEANSKGSAIRSVTIDSDIRQSGPYDVSGGAPRFYHDPAIKSYHLYGPAGVRGNDDDFWLWETYDYNWVRTYQWYIHCQGLYHWPGPWVRNEYGSVHQNPGSYFYPLASEAVFFKNGKMYVCKYNELVYWPTGPSGPYPVPVPYTPIGFIDWANYYMTGVPTVVYPSPNITLPDNWNEAGWEGATYMLVNYKNKKDKNNYTQPLSDYAQYRQ